jgi:hypothetical protein
MRRRVPLTLWLAAMAWLAVVPAASAYVDPGSTSMIFQAVIAGLAAAGTALTVFWSRIKRFFSRGDSSHPALEDDAAGPADRS